MSSKQSGSGPCGACKFLRRKCLPGCIFAPYFDSEQGTAHFAAVHKVFGASNVSKLLLHIPVHRRLDAAITICYEAQARVRDPVFGCVAQIFALQQQAARLRAELSYLQAYLTTSPTPSDLSLLLNPVVQTSQAIQPHMDPCRIGSNYFPSMESRDQQLVYKRLGSTQFTGTSPFP